MSAALIIQMMCFDCLYHAVLKYNIAFIKNGAYRSIELSFAYYNKSVKKQKPWDLGSTLIIGKNRYYNEVSLRLLSLSTNW